MCVPREVIDVFPDTGVFSDTSNKPSISLCTLSDVAASVEPRLLITVADRNPLTSRDLMCGERG